VRGAGQGATQSGGSRTAQEEYVSLMEVARLNILVVLIMAIFLHNKNNMLQVQLMKYQMAIKHKGQ
jgi:hypothetical protein